MIISLFLSVHLEQIPLEFTDWNRGFSRKPPKGLTPEAVNPTGNRSRIKFLLYFPLSFEHPGILPLKTWLFSAGIRMCPFISETSLLLAGLAEMAFNPVMLHFLQEISRFQSHSAHRFSGK